MKLVVAFVKQFRLEAVRDALAAAGVTGMSVSEVRGFGRQLGQTEVYRGAEYEVRFLPKIRIEVLSDDANVPRIVGAIIEAARTGEIGDGKIAVLPVDDVIRIRTGESGIQAL
jgi:nitrogen regulatory protein P-II 1